MRRCHWVAVAGALRLVAVQHVLEHRRRHKIQCDLELCHVQVLVASSASAIIEGRNDGGKRKARHHEVRISPIRIRRGTIWPACQPGHTTQGRQYWAKARLPRIGPTPQHRCAEEDDIRLQLAQFVVAQPHFSMVPGVKFSVTRSAQATEAFHNIDGLRMGHVEAKRICWRYSWHNSHYDSVHALATKGGECAACPVRPRLDTHHRSAVFHQVTGGHGPAATQQKSKTFSPSSGRMSIP